MMKITHCWLAHSACGMMLHYCTHQSKSVSVLSVEEMHICIPGMKLPTVTSWTFGGMLFFVCLFFTVAAAHIMISVQRSRQVHRATQSMQIWHYYTENKWEHCELTAAPASVPGIMQISVKVTKWTLNSTMRHRLNMQKSILKLLFFCRFILLFFRYTEKDCIYEYQHQ